MACCTVGLESFPQIDISIFIFKWAEQDVDNASKKLPSFYFSDIVLWRNFCYYPSKIDIQTLLGRNVIVEKC